MGYRVADQLRLILEEENREILGNQRAVYEAVKDLITETSLVKFSVIAIQQNFILLPTYTLYVLPPLSDISDQASNTEKLSVFLPSPRRYSSE
jgi:hypothetical protein